MKEFIINKKQNNDIFILLDLWGTSELRGKDWF
jgi:hypothetical protein